MKAASPVIVDLYRLAYNAGRAVTFDELVDGMPSAYQNDANRWYVQKMRDEGILLKEDGWPPEMLRSVKEKWVAEQVETMTHTKRFSIRRADGRSARYMGRQPREDLVYEAIKERPPGSKQGGPPMVEEEVLVKRMVPWTPEIGATGRRHVAGIQFRDEMRRIEQLGVKATKTDLQTALELAMEALSYQPKT